MEESNDSNVGVKGGEDKEEDEEEDEIKDASEKSTPTRLRPK